MGKILCFIYEEMVDFEMTLACHLLNREIICIAYEKQVVKDQNIITALGNAFVDFAVEILDYFKLFKEEKDKQDMSNHYKCII